MRIKHAYIEDQMAYRFHSNTFTIFIGLTMDNPKFNICADKTFFNNFGGYVYTRELERIKL
jgi:hypothetical protein